VLRLRWVSLFGQLLILGVAQRWFDAQLQWSVAAVALSFGFLSNVALDWWLRRRSPIRDADSGEIVNAVTESVTTTRFAQVAGWVLCFDTLVLTALLAASGAAANPFTTAYIVHIVLAALLLDRRWTTAVTALSAACFAVLFLFPRVCHVTVGENYSHHLHGMWWAFATAAATVAYLVREISLKIETQRAQIAELERRARENTHIASLSTLAAGAAHELRTPLSTIAVAVHEMRRNVVQKKDQDDLDLIDAEIERCQQILWNLGPKFSEQERQCVPVLASQVATHLIEELRTTPELVQKQSTGLSKPVVLGSADGSARTFSVESELRSVLRSLIKNAQDALENVGTRVVLSVQQEAGSVCFAIEDDGEGMSESVIQRACDPFFTTKEPGKGMGLGLFLAQTYAQNAGGSLRLESRSGRGTRAELRLPALRGNR
jgi:two-component system, sensor histidine kinase RegB